VGNELAKWMTFSMDFSKWALEAGYPTMRSGMAKAPFDTLGDTLRGTKGIFMDIYRQPKKLLEAIDTITAVTINQTVTAANASQSMIVMFPLHKGADGFMSQKQLKILLPSLKKVCLGLNRSRHHAHAVRRGKLQLTPGKRQ
jgi:uroporphyrinogen-III decarboxylase